MHILFVPSQFSLVQYVGDIYCYRLSGKVDFMLAYNMTYLMYFDVEYVKEN